MTAYQKMINDIINKKQMQEINQHESVADFDKEGNIENETNEPIEKLENESASEQESIDSPLKEELLEKIGEYKKNMPLFEVLFTDVMKKNNVNLDEELKELNPKEKEGIVNLVLDLIKQFENVERKEEVK